VKAKEEAAAAEAAAGADEARRQQMEEEVCQPWLGFGKPSPRKQTQDWIAARLDLEVSAGWVRPFSRGLWGGDALLLSCSNLNLPGWIQEEMLRWEQQAEDAKRRRQAHDDEQAAVAAATAAKDKVPPL
jgi:hypothetical protein